MRLTHPCWPDRGNERCDVRCLAAAWATLFRMRPTEGPVIRRTTADDVESVVTLAATSLGWAGDERDRAFFRWKHLENPFGPSPGWAVHEGGDIVAFRTLMRWRLRRGGEQLRVVRAVDTATHPEYQGRGLFRALTMEAIHALTAEGIDAVFNTPNEQSRPGYMKMGWSVLGRPTLMVHPSSPVSVIRMVRARVPAEKWSIPVSAGEPVETVLDDLQVPVADDGTVWSTDRSSAYFAWRYGFEPLHYRVAEIAGGHAIFRVRRRGALREVAIVEWLSDRRDVRGLRRLVRQVGDYAVAVGIGPFDGFFPLPRQGPVVTWRPLARVGVPDLSAVNFALGDIELL